MSEPSREVVRVGLMVSVSLGKIKRECDSMIEALDRLYTQRDRLALSDTQIEELINATALAKCLKRRASIYERTD